MHAAQILPSAQNLPMPWHTIVQKACKIEMFKLFTHCNESRTFILPSGSVPACHSGGLVASTLCRGRTQAVANEKKSGIGRRPRSGLSERRNPALPEKNACVHTRKTSPREKSR